MTVVPGRDQIIAANPVANQAPSILTRFLPDGNLKRSLDELRNKVNVAVSIHYNNLLDSIAEKYPLDGAKPSVGFGSIHPLWVDAGSLAAGYFSRNYPRVHSILENTAYLRLTHRACQAIGLRASFVLSGVLTLANRYCSTNSAMKTILESNPRVKNFMQKAQFASYASIAFSLVKNKLIDKAHKRYKTHLSSKPDRQKVLKAMHNKGKAALFGPHTPGAGPAGSEPNRYDTIRFGESLQALDTTNMSLSAFVPLAKVGIDRDKEFSLISEKAIWDNLNTKSEGYKEAVTRSLTDATTRVEAARALVNEWRNARQELVVVQQEIGLIDLNPTFRYAGYNPQSLLERQQLRALHAQAMAREAAIRQRIAASGLSQDPLNANLNMAKLSLTKLQVEQWNRQFTNVLLQRPDLAAVQNEKPIMDKCVFTARVLPEIFQALQGTPREFLANIAIIAGNVTLPAEKELLANTLHAMIDPLPGWNQHRKDLFVRAIIENNAAYLASNLVETPGRAVLDAVMLGALSNKAVELSANLLVEVNSSLDRVSDVLGMNVRMIDPFAGAAIAAEAEAMRVENNDTSLWKLDGEHGELIAAVNKEARIGESPRLYPDVRTTIDPATQQVFVAQFRERGVLGDLDIASKLGSKFTDCVINQDGESTLLAKYSIVDMMDKVMTKDLPNLTFEEEFVPVYNPRTGWELHYKKATKADLQDLVDRLESPASRADRNKTNAQRLAEQANANHRLTAEIFRTIGKHLMSQMIKQFVDGTIIEADLDTLRRTITFLDVINNNHFVNNCDNTIPFTPHDEDYKNHALIYKTYIRGPIVEQLAKRKAITEATNTASAKTGAAFRKTSDQVDLEQRRVVENAMKGLNNSMFIKKRGKFTNLMKESVLEGTLLEETDKRRISFRNTFHQLGSVIQNIHDTVRVEPRSLEAFAKVDPTTGTSRLQEFYRNAYFIKLALENRAVRATILPMMHGGETEVNALLQQINLCIACLDLAYKNSFNQREFGADLHQAEALKAQKKAEEIGKIQANSEFRLNAFEKEALSFGDSALLAGWNLFK